MNTKIKLAIAFYASTQIQNELIDELKGTSIYKHRYKNLINQIQKENDSYINQLYGHLDHDSEDYFYKTVEMIETIIEVVKEKDIDVFIELLKEFKDGNIGLLPDGKHKKIFEQIKKL